MVLAHPDTPGHLAMVGDVSDGHQEVPLTSSGYRPEMLLNVLQCTGPGLS